MTWRPPYRASSLPGISKVGSPGNRKNVEDGQGRKYPMFLLGRHRHCHPGTRANVEKENAAEISHSCPPEMAYGMPSIDSGAWTRGPLKSSSFLRLTGKMLPEDHSDLGGTHRISHKALGPNGEKNTDLLTLPTISLTKLLCARHHAGPWSTQCTCKARLVPGTTGLVGKRVPTAKKGFGSSIWDWLSTH